MTETKIDIGQLTKDLVKVKTIYESTDNLVTQSICQMYVELCEEIAKGITNIDEFTMNIVKQDLAMHNNMDDPNRHNIAGGANSPSDMQKIAFELENK